ncbi:hypothetical protein FA13DRAFT_647631 [Coprinellus micaceus]|uniref:Uncharacterized protein n=1 Tax=Coprinellus micaceus TaxID=71717 RepID=A0A4Y7T5S9_COPMI|nr:hypothetical protein FA13DRAFT_647631 [Coprinellus micaceus]
MAPMASPPQVRRDPPRAASATIAAAMQQRHPSISSVVASTSQNPYQGSRNQRAASGPPTGKTRAPPLSKNRNIPSSLDDDSDDLDGFDSSDDDNLDIFYTPAQSPRTSMASSSIAFPSRRNTSPRQATRRSLRMSHASSGIVVAPGISASNSGSSIKPSPSHVNGKEASTTTTTAPSKAPAPMPLVTPTHQQPNPASNGSTANRRPTLGSPAQPQASGKATTQPQQQQQVHRKPAESSPVPRPPSTSNQKPPQPSSSSSVQTRTPTNAAARRISQETPTKTASTPIRSSRGSFSPDSSFNSSPASTANAGATGASTSSSRSQRTPTIPKRAIPPAPSDRSSGLSLTSTTLENHSDVFSITNSELISQSVSHSTVMTSPVQSSSSGVARKPSPLSSAAESRASTVRSNSLRSTRTPISTSRNISAKPSAPKSNGAPVRNYSYTDDDWRKETESLVDSLVSNRQSLVDSAAVAQAYLDKEATEEKYAPSPVKRRGSVKRDEHGRNLSIGHPAEIDERRQGHPWFPAADTPGRCEGQGEREGETQQAEEEEDRGICGSERGGLLHCEAWHANASPIASSRAHQRCRPWDWLGHHKEATHRLPRHPSFRRNRRAGMASLMLLNQAS